MRRRYVLALVLATALVFALAGTGVGYWVLPEGDAGRDLGASSDPQTSQTVAATLPVETTYTRRLTSTEAAPLFETKWGLALLETEWDFSKALDEGTLNTFEAAGKLIYYVEDCSADDFNEYKRAWVITCTDVLKKLEPRPGELPNVLYKEISRYPNSVYLLSDETEEMTNLRGFTVPVEATN